MVDACRPKSYPIPRGFVTADPGKNRYIRKHGTSMELPPRLNPHYYHDKWEQRNNFNWRGVAADLGSIAGRSAVGALVAPATIVSGLSTAGIAGLETASELAHQPKKRK